MERVTIVAGLNIRILPGQIALSGISTKISSRWKEGPTLREGGYADAGDIPTWLNSNNQIQP